MSALVLGKRYPLVMYRENIDRLWKITLPFAIILIALWVGPGREYPYIGYLDPVPDPFNLLVYIGGPLLAVFSLFFVLVRNLAYVQAKKDHLKVATPFFSFKVSYRRIRSVHPGHISQLYENRKIKGSLRKQIQPYLGRTALVVDMAGYPLSRVTLETMIGPAILLPGASSLVLLTPDWMALSTELDSFFSQYRQDRTANQMQGRAQASGRGYGLFSGINKK